MSYAAFARLTSFEISEYPLKMLFENKDSFQRILGILQCQPNLLSTRGNQNLHGADISFEVEQTL